VKKVSMELGGNAPFIVFDDADINAAVQGAIVSKYRNAGQTCVCTNRILVQESVLAEFTEKFVNAVEALKLGNGLDSDVNVGPMISTSALNDVKQLVAQSVDAGARVLTGANQSRVVVFTNRPF
jgi:succinate-semialdehyde dehydrogenase/glutarate-semialdehyde dehydrogenase